MVERGILFSQAGKVEREYHKEYSMELRNPHFGKYSDSFKRCNYFVTKEDAEKYDAIVENLIEKVVF